MFHNMLMTSFTPLSSKTEINSWENQPFTTEWPTNTHPHQQYQVKDTTEIIKRRKRRSRTCFTTQQLEELEKAFTRNNYIDRTGRCRLSDFLKINERCIKVWFQNRRMRKKKEHQESESDCSIKSFSCSSPQLYASQSQPTQPNIHNTHEITNQYYFNNNSNNYHLPPNYNNIKIEPGSENLEQPHNASELRLIDADPTYYSRHNENNNMNSMSVDTNVLQDFYEKTQYTSL